MSQAGKWVPVCGWGCGFDDVVYVVWRGFAFSLHGYPGNPSAVIVWLYQYLDRFSDAVEVPKISEWFRQLSKFLNGLVKDIDDRSDWLDLYQ